MAKKSQKKNLKKKYKYIEKKLTLWDIIDESSKEVLLNAKANVIKDNYDYSNNTNK